MKKFEFSLRKLNDYKNQVLKVEQETLSSFRQRQNELVQKKLQLEDSYSNNKTQFQEQARIGMTSQHIKYNRLYINSLMEQIRFTETSISNMDSIIEKQVGVVVEISKDVKIMEKLKEKQLGEYKAAEQKQFDRFIEEFVSSSKLVNS